ncbi:DivIVA domain-containing protein [Amycolatopsis sp. cmx-4-61]|uniref:DivIVA domain-containing protein n=1 Tax=Amycolatopsis sp. cmx-4-61 TaxID=2790937 RepID=UPI003979C9A5
MTAPLPLPESFALTFRGYDREQVDERIDELLAEIRLLTADRDAAVAEAEHLARRLERARADHAELSARTDRLCRTPADPAAVGDRVRHLLELAHGEADEIVATARERAAAIVREAEEAAQQRIADARAQAYRTVDDARRRADRLAAIERRTADRLREIDAFLADAEGLLGEHTPLRAVA